MRYIHTIVLLLMMLLPLGSMAQSLEIVEEFKENKMSTVLTTYKNEFGHREKQHVLDNKFPFAVLEVYLEGDEQAVKAAKSKLSLDLGSHFTIEGVCKTYTNRIVFLISSSVRNVYMTCGDGCKEQVIFSGQTLEQNKIYSGRVKYTPAKIAPTKSNIDSLKKQIIEDYKISMHTSRSDQYAYPPSHQFPTSPTKIDALYYRVAEDGVSVKVTSELSESPYYKTKNRLSKVSILDNVEYDGKMYNVTGIDNYAFINCQNLKKVTISNSVTHIGGWAFSDCYKLKSITIPSSVRIIHEGAFAGCKKLVSIEIPNGVTHIGNSAFFYCKKLTTVSIPNSVENIGNDAFDWCENLKTIYIPKGTKAKYATMDGMKGHVDKLVEDATVIGDVETIFQLGMDFFEGGNNKLQDYIQAANQFLMAAKMGHKEAQYYIAYCYQHGLGVKLDEAESVKWYIQAANQGDIDAQYNLGNCYENGIGVIQDWIEAIKWYKKAADSGDSYAQYKLGKCYNNGIGVPRNMQEAVKWYRKSAEQGYSFAQFYLGRCYYQGDGVPVDYFEALKWYHAAAIQENKYGQYELALCYYYGEGVTQNYTEAVKWLSKAANQGDEYAYYYLGICYEYGQGVDKDLIVAKRHYQQAADLGHEKAKNKLKSI